MEDDVSRVFIIRVPGEKEDDWGRKARISKMPGAKERNRRNKSFPIVRFGSRVRLQNLNPTRETKKNDMQLRFKVGWLLMTAKTCHRDGFMIIKSVACCEDGVSHGANDL